MHAPSIRNRLRRFAPWLLDTSIALGLTILLVGSLVANEPTATAPTDADVIGVVVTAIGCLALLFRRRAPVQVLVITLVAAYMTYLREYPDHGLPLPSIVALYTVASRCTRRTTITMSILVLVSLPIAFGVRGGEEFSLGGIVSNTAMFVAAAALGDRKQVRDAYLEQLELRAADQERERLEAAERAVGEERLRIARELHDVLTHTMSVVAVQSGVGAHVIDQQPAEAKRMLESISASSRDALTEMRRLLSVLRDDPSEPGALAPAQSLTGVEEMAARVTEAGVTVTVRHEGERPVLPPGVDLAAYRIVQEALTNVLKHAGPAHADVLIRYAPDTLHLEIVDDGRGASAPHGSDGGHGLIGMRERAALYGGTLQAAPKPGGGYRVIATLKYTSPARAEASVAS